MFLKWQHCVAQADFKQKQARHSHAHLSGVCTLVLRGDHLHRLSVRLSDTSNLRHSLHLEEALKGQQRAHVRYST